MWIAIFLMGMLALPVLLATGQLRPPRPLPIDAPPDAFSAERAMVHLQSIARQPRPTGSAALREARDYLYHELDRLGLETELQRGSIAHGERLWEVENVVGRLPGTEGAGTLLLVAHYDSWPGSPGAGDNGISVSALLEVLRALQDTTPPRNDLIVLLTDGEEVGLLGARLFVQEHRWLDNVDLVINLDGGGQGVPLLLETSPQNGWLIREYARAASQPLAASWANEIFQRLPFDTDFTPFCRAGFAGLNVNVVGDRLTMHTPQDTIANLDRRSLQAHGSHTLALVRHFGDVDLRRPGAPDVVFFSLPGGILVHYPTTWALPLVLLAGLAWAAATLWLARRRRLSLLGVVSGTLALVAGLITLPLATWLIWQALRAAHPSYAELSALGHTPNSHFYFYAFIALTVSATTALYALLRRRLALAELGVGALFWWLLLALWSALAMPGLSYLLTWPLLFGLLALVASPGDDHVSWPHLVLLGVSAAPGILLAAPAFYFLFIALGVSGYGVVTALMVLLLGTLWPQIEVLITPRRIWLPLITLAVGVGFLVAGSLTVG